MSGIGFGKKLYISSVGIIMLTIFIVAGVNFFSTKKSFLAKGKAGIQSVSAVLADTAELQYNLQKQKLASDLGILITEGSSSGKITLVNSRTGEIDITNILTKETARITMPKLVFGLKFILNDYEIVDTVAKFSDSEIMFCQLFENKLIKVSTSLKTEGDQRATGGYYEQDQLLTRPLPRRQMRSSWRKRPG